MSGHLRVYNFKLINFSTDLKIRVDRASHCSLAYGLWSPRILIATIRKGNGERESSGSHEEPSPTPGEESPVKRHYQGHFARLYFETSE